MHGGDCMRKNREYKPDVAIWLVSIEATKLYEAIHFHSTGSDSSVHPAPKIIELNRDRKIKVMGMN